MSQQPPKSEIQKLGIDVEFTTTEMQKENGEAGLIKKIGEHRTPYGNEYVGSVVVHYYIDTNAFLKQRYEVNNVVFINFTKDISENIGALGMNNAVIQLRKYFNPQFKHKSTNSKDKRDDIIK